jgi:predicted Zn finger-like uncharacterized protein|tara:strand:+ start:408 stop:866 length:459 start_codon:yes stop_codon:yes gene_type:complete
MMIISCNNCNKKFDIDSDLIPEKGRLLLCSICNHEWFFKKDVTLDLIEPISDENFKVFENEGVKKNKSLDIEEEVKIPVKEVIEKIAYKSSKNQKLNILNLTIVFIISFVAIIILIDTFKTPLGNIFPETEILLYNFYETITDITLFVRNLI